MCNQFFFKKICQWQDKIVMTSLTFKNELKGWEGGGVPLEIGTGTRGKTFKQDL